MHDDKFFINLTMSLSGKDQELYNEWSLWAASSNNKYYIDARRIEDDIIFFTKERTSLEIELITKRNEEMAKLSELNLNLEDEIDKKYYDYAIEFIDSMAILSAKIMPYEIFKRRFK